MCKSCGALFVAILSAEAACSPRSRAESPQPDDTSAVLEQFDVAGDGGMLLIPASVEGHSCVCLVDTGASMTVFDSSLKQLLTFTNATIQATTPTGSVDVALCDPPNLSVGKLAVRLEDPIGCRDLGPWRWSPDHELFGIIGMDVLGQHIVHLDFDEGRLSFLKSVPKSWEALLPIDGQAHSPVVHTAVQSGPAVPCLIDTGCVGMVGGLNSQVFNSLEARHLVTPIGSSFFTDLCRKSQQRVGRLPALSLGNFKLPAAVVGEHTGPNLLGLGFWSRFNVTFDFAKRAMYLKRNDNFELAANANLSGLHLLRRRGEFVVDHFDRESPAQLAGVEVKDVIESVDDQRADRLKLSSLRRLLCTAGKMVRLTLRRRDRLIAVRFTLPGERVGPPEPSVAFN